MHTKATGLRKWFSTGITSLTPSARKNTLGYNWTFVNDVPHISQVYGLTLVWCVCVLSCTQRPVDLVKWFSTNITSVWFQTCVYSFMLLESSWTMKWFSTGITSVVFQTCVCVLSCSLSPLEWWNDFPQVSQVNGLTTGVYSFMIFECIGLCKWFSTGVTSVWFNTGRVFFHDVWVYRIV